MKMMRFLVCFYVLVAFAGCIPVMDEPETLSFWTDNELDEEGFHVFFINDIVVGDLQPGLEDPICNDMGLLNFKSEMSEDLVLSVRNEEGESIEIGVVNLFSISSGIKIKPSEKGKIFVDRSLDDMCTLIRLNWKE